MNAVRTAALYLILVLFLSFAFLSHTVIFSSRISCFLKPDKVAKGSVLIMVFQDLDDDKKYLLKVKGNRLYEYQINNIKYYTVKLIGIPLDSPAKIHITLLEDGEEVFEHDLKVYEKKVDVSHIKVMQKYVEHPESLQERIFKENQMKLDAKKSILVERLFFGAPGYPVAKMSISTPFGFKRIYNDQKKSIHYGTDLAAPLGTPVKTIFEGRVVLAENLYYTGNTVFINHGDGLISLYAHMDKPNVKENQMVKKGDVIGTVGQTGRSTGPHLHLGVYINRVTVDPMSLFQVMSMKED